MDILTTSMAPTAPKQSHVGPSSSKQVAPASQHSHEPTVRTRGVAKRDAQSAVERPKAEGKSEKRAPWYRKDKKSDKSARKGTEPVPIAKNESDSVQHSRPINRDEAEDCLVFESRRLAEALAALGLSDGLEAEKKTGKRLRRGRGKGHKAKVPEPVREVNKEPTKEASAKSARVAKSPKGKFKAHLSTRELRRLLADQRVEKIEYVEGNIRINPKFHQKAYVAVCSGENDLLIDGKLDRNRALEGDLVVVKIDPPEKWQQMANGEYQKTAVVIGILEKVHPRKVVGCLKQVPDKNSRYVMFVPRDYKVPRLNIDASQCPKEFHEDPEAYGNTLILAQIVAWDDVRFAIGKILKIVGQAGDLKAEATAILLDNDLDIVPYGPELTCNLPASDYVPTAADLKGRDDWREECVFTIDPITARDLDDAVSCKLLDNGNYRIGVHISDVTHYLEASSPLDKAVSKRATTIYMVDRVYHMLPQELCNVCSLLPGRDKLAFSVIFEMTPEAELVNARFAKTVIRSCCQLAYEHAQEMITDPGRKWAEGDLPEIHGPWSVEDLSTTVNILNRLAVIMRERRFNTGALSLDQPKLSIHLDQTTGLPLSFSLEVRQDSNKLIEEFMLLANNAAARQIFKYFPNVAMLRRHEAPISRMLSETQATLQKLGIHLDIESAGALQKSLSRYEPDMFGSSPKDYCLANYRIMVINALCAKPMKRAEYFCTSADMSEEETRHYALNVPLYTHFTSPIRRYADCIVHRLLHAVLLEDHGIPHWSAEQCARVAGNCNRKKYRAKCAQETSTESYLLNLLEMTGPITTVAIAMDVKDRSFDVIACSIGVTLRIYLDSLEELARIEHGTNDGVQTLTIQWREPISTQVINIFSIVKIRVGKHPTVNRLRGELLPPDII